MIDLSLDTLKARMDETAEDATTTCEYELLIQPNDRAVNWDEKVKFALTYDECLEFAFMSPKMQRLVVLGILKDATVISKRKLIANHNYCLLRNQRCSTGFFRTTMLTDLRDNKGNEGLEAWLNNIKTK